MILIVFVDNHAEFSEIFSTCENHTWLRDGRLIGTLRFIGRQRDGNDEKTLYDIA